MKTIEQTYWNIIFKDKYDLEAFPNDLNDQNHDYPKALDPYTILGIPQLDLISKRTKEQLYNIIYIPFIG